MKKLIEYLPPDYDAYVAINISALCAAIEQYIEDREQQKENDKVWRIWNEAA